MADVGPPVAVDGSTLLRVVVGFGRELRAAGLSGDLVSVMDFARALTVVDIGARDEVRAAGAACFVRRREELPAYHDTFNRYWRVPGVGAPREARLRSVHRVGVADDGAPPGTEPEGSDAAQLVRRVGWSDAELLRHRSFAAMTPAELRDAERMVSELEPRLAVRRTRRTKRHPHGRRLAPRAMLREGLATEGETLRWFWRRQLTRPRPIVALVDISGSMDRHARLLLRFVHALARTSSRTEAFVFGTRLTRITRLLEERDPDTALRRIADEATFGAGGTRIGEAFHTFNRVWARRVLPGSAVVVILSDGWDHGRPELIAAETARLARRCHELIWLNPLASGPNYEPLASGMAAALPFVHRFLPAGDIASLEALGRVLASGSRI